MQPTWKGTFPAVTTQFRSDLSLDLEATASHIEALLDAGVNGLIMLGSLGENMTLLPTEKLDVMRMALEVTTERVPVVSGVAEYTPGFAIEYSQAMEKLGASGLMLLPAMVYRADALETVTFYRSVAASTGLPIIVYNNPVGYGVDITPEILAELADVTNLVAVKESSNDTRRFTDIRNLLGDRYELLIGVDDIALEAILLGADGWIYGSGLAFPKENQRLWELASAGLLCEAQALNRWFMPMLHLDSHPKFVQYIKLAIQECGLGAEWVRLPRLPISGDERERALKVIHHSIETRPALQ